MRIALGVTGRQKSLLSGGLDGIGVYAQNLFGQLQSDNQTKVVETVFSSEVFDEQELQNHRLLPPFPNCLLKGIVSDTSICPNLLSDFDLFHATDHRIPKIKSLPVIATIHDTIPITAPELVSFRQRWIFAPLFKMTVDWCDFVITVSEFSKSEIVRVLGIKEEKVKVIYNGVNEEWFTPITEAHSLQVRQAHGLLKPFFLSVGTIQPRKNISKIIDAYMALPLTIRQNYDMVFIGKAGWNSKTILQRLNTLKADYGIRWLGHMSERDTQILMKSATGFIFPSLSEGYGLPVVEAFAASTPVVTSNTTALNEIGNGRSIMVNPNSTQQIMDGMRSIVRGGTTISLNVEEGKKFALTQTWAKTASLTLETYKRLI